MEIRRNARFYVGESVEILFNPIVKLEAGDLARRVSEYEYESFIEYSQYSGSDTGISLNDVIANKYFGGRVAAANTGSISIGIPYDCFAGQYGTYMRGFNTVDTYVFERKDVADYFYCLSGAGYIAESGGNDNNRITGAYVGEIGIEVSNQRFGYGYQFYGSKWEDTITVSIPASTPEWKLSQMMNSIAVAVKGNNTIYGNLPVYSEYDTEYDTEYGEDSLGSGDYTLIDNYNYYVQNFGGSCNPVIRMVDIKTNSIRFNSRRNVFEVEMVIMG